MPLSDLPVPRSAPLLADLAEKRRIRRYRQATGREPAPRVIAPNVVTLAEDGLPLGSIGRILEGRA